MIEPDGVTTFSGLIVLTIALIIKDVVLGKKRTTTDEAKLLELQQQTGLLERIAKGNKKSNKKIFKKLNVIHDDVVTVKQQTKREL